MSTYSNPGDLAWSLAWNAADDLIERANLCKSLLDIRRVATHWLALTFLPAAALVVAKGGTRFDLVRDDDSDEEAAVVKTWAVDVVHATIAALAKRAA